jgi:hypothetical protein
LAAYIYYGSKKNGSKPKNPRKPTLKDIYVRDKDGKEKEPKRLLGRVPVLDSQFLIPRPVTSATITFHGMCAFNSIAFYGRRAENSMRPFNDEKTTRDYI